MAVITNEYKWFLYLGIAFFILNFFIYGISLNLSYFGIVLIYIGFRKPSLTGWFKKLLWFFIFLDIYIYFNEIRTKLSKPYFVKFNENVKEGAKTKEDTNTEQTDDDE